MEFRAPRAGLERFVKAFFSVFLYAVFTASFALADGPKFYDNARFTLYFPKTERAVRYDAKTLVRETLPILEQTYGELTALFKREIKQKVVVRFLTPGEFHRRTRAPAWTSAMYLRGEISIPIQSLDRVNLGEIRRALRHEYVHAVIAELSGKRCPAWLDEGIAQLFEGDVNPLLGPALRNWAPTNEALPLSWLQSGFMTLADEVVPVAYAQSLFASRKLVREVGFSAIGEYLKALEKGSDESRAFQESFRTTEKQFEQVLSHEMRRWAETAALHP